MAAKAMTASGAKSATSRPKEFNFVWEGRDRAGKTLRGETRASGETIVVNTLRRQGIVVTRIKKQRYKAARGKIQDKDITLFTRQLATMMKAGVPLVEALDSVGGAAGNIVYLQATKKIQQEVSTGTSLTVAMNNANVFPNMVLQMASIGEESGSLDSMLGKSADVYEREVDDAVESLSSLMEPLIMVVLGTLIGGLVVAMYLPIFKLGQVV